MTGLTTTTASAGFLCVIPQKPSPTPPAQPLPPNYRPPKDLEDPCISRIGAVTNDLRKIAQMVHGRLTGYDFTSQKRHAFPGADINPRGQSFGQAISRLGKNGFESSTVLGIQWSHLEGAGYQKKFSDGLWYHVIVAFPTDPRRPTPQITAHCHATNPTGLAHFLDSIP